MHWDVDAYVVNWESCQSNKPCNHSPYGSAQPVPVPELPWTSVGIEFVGPFPMSSSGHNYAIMFTDYLTRQIRTVPIQCNDVNTFCAQHLA